jgi:hypothetical protein
MRKNLVDVTSNRQKLTTTDKCPQTDNRQVTATVNNDRNKYRTTVEQGKDITVYQT